MRISRMNLEAVLSMITDGLSMEDFFFVDPNYNPHIRGSVVVKVHQVDKSGNEEIYSYWNPVMDDGTALCADNRPVLVRGVKPDSINRIKRLDLYLDENKEIIPKEDFEDLVDRIQFECGSCDGDLYALQKRVLRLEQALDISADHDDRFSSVRKREAFMDDLRSLDQQDDHYTQLCGISLPRNIRYAIEELDQS